jgi:hypothetical protein
VLQELDDEERREGRDNLDVEDDIFDISDDSEGEEEYVFEDVLHSSDSEQSDDGDDVNHPYNFDVYLGQGKHIDTFWLNSS